MSVQLFVDADQLRPGPLLLSGQKHHYLTHVRRLRTGDRIVLFDGNGNRAEGILSTVSNQNTQVNIGEKQMMPPPTFLLTIVPALLKGEHMSQAITKMVELGVSLIRPIITERTIVRPKGKRLLQRHKRYQALVTAAAKQCQNPHPTQIAPVESLDKLLEKPTDTDIQLIPDVGTNAKSLFDALCNADSKGPIRSGTVLIGPEGGFTDNEVAAAAAAGFTPVCLGDRILRAETASITVASILAFRYGDVGRR